MEDVNNHQTLLFGITMRALGNKWIPVMRTTIERANAVP